MSSEELRFKIAKLDRKGIKWLSKRSSEKSEKIFHGYFRNPDVDEVDIVEARKKPSFLRKLFATFR